MKKLTAVVCAALILFAAVALTYVITVNTFTGGWYGGAASDKVAEIEQILAEYFVDPIDETALGDAAADAVIAATGDRWSYYIPASEYQGYEEQMSNAYYGIGIVIQQEDGLDGFRITSVTQDAPAWNAGVRVNDVLIRVGTESVSELGLTETKNRVRGANGTSVLLGFLRDGKEFSCEIVRGPVQTVVASCEMLEDGIGYILIDNFDENCSAQTISCIRQMTEEGAKALLFDVRMNPGGMKDELTKVLDYLLPEGEIFHAVESNGAESRDYSDASCVELPMAVLVDEDSYSAAEFFAAALQQYEWAAVVGQKTCGKGNFQYTFRLSDGSAVAVSSGRYYTPSGLRLTDIGVEPDIPAALTEEQQEKLWFGELPLSEDPQVAAAMEYLREKIA